MRALITIKTNRNQSWRKYIVECDAGARRIQMQDTDDTGDAAAIAMSFAMHCGKSYTIVGASEVLAHIPNDFRASK